MRLSNRRFARFAALPLTALALVPVALPAQPAPVQVRAEEPWLYKGSDVPQDKAWTFGTLPNGLRYAIRRNAVPPGQVSIRVRIDAGSLYENEGEQGFAHFIEHLSFRGSRNMPELEAKRVWQRLGATFGSDSNASTTPTETVYKLDLPSARPESVDESLRILAGMMDSPNIDAATVEAEKAVVLAEQREQFGAAVRMDEATRALFFRGQKLASRPTIGTTKTLNEATAPALKAFHDRWYRPERTVIVIAGDMEPATMEAMVRARFGAWRGAGPNPADPDFGRPQANGPTAAALVEPSFPTIVRMSVLRPWEPVDDTIAYNEGLMVDALAVRLINRRLETRARTGGSFLSAQVDQQDLSRSVDATFVSLQPLGDDWQAATRDVRAVIADATTTAPSQADIDREVQEFDLALLAQLENEGAEPGKKQADDLVKAIDIRETVTTSQGALDIFRGANRLFKPANLLAATKRLFTGAGPRIMLSSPKTLANETQLAAALKADVSGVLAGADARKVSFADVPKLGAPATVGERSKLANIPIETVTLSNGVKLLLFPNKGEPGKIYVTARFGDGIKALPRDRQTLAWSGALALVGSGIGDLGLEELDRLTNGRKINLGVGISEDAFVLSGETRAPDLADQLTLMAAKLGAPGWDPNPVIRAKAQMLSAIELQRASPAAVVQRDLDTLVRGGDPRWATPDRAQIEKLNPKAFRAFWEPLLKTGPIEVQIFGDFETAQAIEAARASFGALEPRPAAGIEAANATTGTPEPTQRPVVRTHTGPAEQSAAVIAWPTGGGLDAIGDARRLEVLAAIFNDRLFDQLRQNAGASYAPSVGSQWPTGMDKGGALIALSQLKPEAMESFFTLARGIAADLVAKPVEADEFQRALGPIRQYYARASTGNQFWMRETAGSSRDPRKIAAMESLARDFSRMTPADVQAAAARYLAPGKAWSMAVLPERKTAAR